MEVMHNGRLSIIQKSWQKRVLELRGLHNNKLIASYHCFKSLVIFLDCSKTGQI